MGIHRTIGNNGFIKNIQYVTLATSGITTTANSTINAVDLAHSVVEYKGSRVAEFNADKGAFKVEFTSTTNLRATRAGAQLEVGTVEAAVTEYYPGVVKSIQNITATIAASSSNVNVAINAVDLSKTQIIDRGQISSVNQVHYGQTHPTFKLTSNTNLLVNTESNIISTIAFDLTILEFY